MAETELPRPITSELYHPVDSVGVLQAARERAAELKATDKLRYFTNDVVASISRGTLTDAHVGSTSGSVHLNPRDLMEFDALGIGPSELFDKLDGTEEEAVALTIDESGEQAKIKKSGEGYTFQLAMNHSFDNLHAPSVALREKIEARYHTSPAYAAFEKAAKAASEQESYPQEIATEPFDPQQDPLGTLAFLSQTGLLDTKELTLARRMRQERLPAAEVLAQGIASLAPTLTTETHTTYEWGDDTKKSITIDNQTGNYTFRARTDAASLYLESALWTKVSAEPFIDTPCGQELLDTLDRAGLMLNPSFLARILAIGDADQYGSVYTYMTREIAKWVNRPDRTSLSKLFVPFNPTYFGDANIGKSPEVMDNEYAIYARSQKREGSDIEAQVREKLATISTEGMGEAATEIIRLSQETAQRDPSQELASDLPITTDVVSMTGSSCYDVATYYIGAAGAMREPGRIFNPSAKTTLQQIEVNGVALLKKTDGQHTFMSINPVTFNGVRLPKGSLFTKSGDGWAFLRLTPMAFDGDEDRKAFEGELPKAEYVHPGMVKRIGGTTLSALVKATELH